MPDEQRPGGFGRMGDEAVVLETAFTSVDMRCVVCQAVWETPVVRIVNVSTHPDARLGILLKTMHRTHCPVCRQERDVDAIFDYYDPERRLLVQVRPVWELMAGGGEDWYWARYEDLVLKYAAIDVRVDVVFGFDAMIEKYLGGQDAVEAARRERSVLQSERSGGRRPSHLPSEEEDWE